MASSTLAVQSTSASLGEHGHLSLTFHKLGAAPVINETLCIGERVQHLFFQPVYLRRAGTPLDCHLIYEKHPNLAAEYSQSLYR